MSRSGSRTSCSRVARRWSRSAQESVEVVARRCVAWAIKPACNRCVMRAEWNKRTQHTGRSAAGALVAKCVCSSCSCDRSSILGSNSHELITCSAPYLHLHGQAVCGLIGFLNFHGAICLALVGATCCSVWVLGYHNVLPYRSASCVLGHVNWIQMSVPVLFSGCDYLVA